VDAQRLGQGQSGQGIVHDAGEQAIHVVRLEADLRQRQHAGLVRQLHAGVAWRLAAAECGSSHDRGLAARESLIHG
jgi:hypothetical protein